MLFAVYKVSALFQLIKASSIDVGVASIMEYQNGLKMSFIERTREMREINLLF
jgi:hypothetical protein